MFFELREDTRAKISLIGEFVMNLAAKVGCRREVFFAKAFTPWNKEFLHILFGYSDPRSPLKSL